MGSVLALLLHRKGHSIVSVISRTSRSARSLARVVRCRTASDQLTDTDPATTLVLIATPEEIIGEIAQELSEVPSIRFRSVAVAHTAGALTSDILSPIVRSGGKTFSLHPVQTFPEGRSLNRQRKVMKGIWYGFEGPKSVRPLARRIVKDLDGYFLDVPKDRKTLYHIACVFASNYPTILVAALERLAAGIGLDGLEPFRNLLQTSIRNSQELGAAPALTGPLARASARVLERHYQELASGDPALLHVYVALGLYGVQLLRSQHRITDEQARQMKSALIKT